MRINQITIEPVIDLEIQLDAETAKSILSNYSHVQHSLTQNGYMHVSFNIYSMLRCCADGLERRKDYRVVIEIGAAKLLSKHLIDNSESVSENVVKFARDVYDELI